MAGGGAPRKTVVLDVVGLTSSLISREHTPFIAAFLADGAESPIEPSFPALTCTVQATYLTGVGQVLEDALAAPRPELLANLLHQPLR